MEGYKGGTMANKANLKKIRKHQILNPTPFEKLFSHKLRGWGVRYRQQYIVGKWYIADFYLPDYKLIVEIDGAAHYTYGLRRDQKRDSNLRFFGFDVLRIRNTEVSDFQKEDLLQITARSPSEDHSFFDSYLQSM